MADSAWLNQNGNVLVNAAGQPVICYECPCSVEYEECSWDEDQYSFEYEECSWDET